MNEKIRNLLGILSYLMMFLVPVFSMAETAHAQSSLNTTITAEDKAAFDQILSPVTKIYNFIKYGASLAAVIALLIAGVNYMYSSNDPRKRDNSKHMASYTLIGIGIIWAAPYLVNFLLN